MDDLATPSLRATVISFGGSARLLEALAAVLEEVGGSWQGQVTLGVYSPSEPGLDRRALQNANAYMLAAEHVRQAALLLRKGTS